MITRLWFVLVGAVAIMSFAAIILVLVPRAMLETVPVPPQLEPYGETAALGRDVYISEGCIYCHSQQVRDANVATDEARGWGRPSVPSDYVYDSPHLLGSMRTGPDLINVGQRLPDRQWHLLHLYQPRALNAWSIMPSFPYLFDEVPADRSVGGEIVQVPAPWAREGVVVVAKPEATALVDYLLSLRRDYPAPELQQQPAGAPVAVDGGAP